MGTREPRNMFLSSAREILEYLQQRLGFSLWMVTRTSGQDWIVLQAEDTIYGVQEGDVFKWSDSFCSRMVEGKGPRITHDAATIPAYAEAPIGRQVPIGAYVGVPLRHVDGELFGTLCAIDPYPQPEIVERELPQIEMMASLLGTILEGELLAIEEQRRAERAEAEAMSDSLTDLFNRRGWDKLVAAEEIRCLRYGHGAAVISIDLDELKQVNDGQGHSAGDQLLKSASRSILAQIRKSDIAARIGGDEFMILAIECNESGVCKLIKRLKKAFVEHGIAASVGYALRDFKSSIREASVEADKEMYANKKRRKELRASGKEECLDPPAEEATIILLDSIQS